MAQELAQRCARVSPSCGRATRTTTFAKDPRLRQIPEQVAELEAELAEAYDEGAQAELRNAERAYASARSSVADLRQRLADHKAAVATFNTVYARHEALEEDLARLEELNREAQARLVQIEVRDVDRYPQLSVIDWPAPEAARIGPPYLLLLGGTLEPACCRDFCRVAVQLPESAQHAAGLRHPVGRAYVSPGFRRRNRPGTGQSNARKRTGAAAHAG
jgi:succinoglycan biosynthesis transport protein ExoP